MQQTTRAIQKLSSEFGLIPVDEADSAINDLMYALSAYLRSPWACTHLASPSAWAVLLVQGVAARRAEGWVVDSSAAAATWCPRRMHSLLASFRGEVFHGTDGETTATLVGGRAPRVGWSKGRRKARIDRLGDDKALKLKARALHRLLEAAGREGLPAEVLDLKPPAVRKYEVRDTELRVRQQKVTVGWTARVIAAAAHRQAAAKESCPSDDERSTVPADSSTESDQDDGFGYLGPPPSLCPDASTEVPLDEEQTAAALEAAWEEVEEDERHQAQRDGASARWVKVTRLPLRSRARSCLRVCARARVPVCSELRPCSRHSSRLSHPPRGRSAPPQACPCGVAHLGGGVAAGGVVLRPRRRCAARAQELRCSRAVPTDRMPHRVHSDARHIVERRQVFGAAPARGAAQTAAGGGAPATGGGRCQAHRGSAGAFAGSRRHAAKVRGEEGRARGQEAGASASAAAGDPPSCQREVESAGSETAPAPGEVGAPTTSGTDADWLQDHSSHTRTRRVCGMPPPTWRREDAAREAIRRPSAPRRGAHVAANAPRLHARVRREYASWTGWRCLSPQLGMCRGQRQRAVNRNQCHVMTDVTTCHVTPSTGPTSAIAP